VFVRVPQSLVPFLFTQYVSTCAHLVHMSASLFVVAIILFGPETRVSRVHMLIHTARVCVSSFHLSHETRDTPEIHHPFSSSPTTTSFSPGHLRTRRPSLSHGARARLRSATRLGRAAAFCTTASAAARLRRSIGKCKGDRDRELGECLATSDVRYESYCSPLFSFLILNHSFYKLSCPTIHRPYHYYPHL